MNPFEKIASLALLRQLQLGLASHIKLYERLNRLKVAANVTAALSLAKQKELLKHFEMWLESTRKGAIDALYRPVARVGPKWRSAPRHVADELSVV